MVGETCKYLHLQSNLSVGQQLHILKSWNMLSDKMDFNIRKPRAKRLKLEKLRCKAIRMLPCTCQLEIKPFKLSSQSSS